MSGDGKKTGGRDFFKGDGKDRYRKKGQTYEHQKQIIEARKINKDEATKILNKFAYMPTEDVINFANDRNNPAMEMLVARVFVEAIKTGDPVRLNLLLDRLIGRVKDYVEHKVDVSFNLHKQLMDFQDRIQERNVNGSEETGSKKAIEEKTWQQKEEIVIESTTLLDSVDCSSIQPEQNRIGRG